MQINSKFLVIRFTICIEVVIEGILVLFLISRMGIRESLTFQHNFFNRFLINILYWIKEFPTYFCFASIFFLIKMDVINYFLLYIFL